MKSITIDNVVGAAPIHSTVWPQSADRGVATRALSVITKEDGEYKRNVYLLEDLRDYDEGYDVTLNWLDPEERRLYQEYENNWRIHESRKRGNSVQAQPGDTIEVYKGRKFPKGSRFVVKSEYTYYNTFGNAVGFYWRTACGKIVPKFNSIIVEEKK